MRRVVAALSFLVVLAGPVQADDAPVATLSDGRTGRIHFESLTPVGYFQLAHRTVTKKTVIFGTLVMPEGVAGRVPAMVIAHGSAGVTKAREFWWAEQLSSIGVAAFIVDSFTPRDIKETTTDQSQLSSAANLADALTALKLLATHPRIDPARIGVMGFSRGGIVAELSALEPYRRAVIDDATRFALHIPLYPYCGDWHVSARTTGAPMLFLLAGSDDYTPPEPCLGYADWFRSKGADVSVVTYPGAYHGFDGTIAPIFLPRLVTARNCEDRIDIDRYTVAIRSTGQDITATSRDYFRGCMGKGATVGGNAEARRRATEDIKAFLKRVFRL
ncbi:MAG: dienelactone hydrolase family protein [Candidatus Eiseniibacteriota bacterium]